MKKILFLFTILFIASQSFGQFSFGVSPRINLNSAYFGYKINAKFVPYIGLQFLNANYNLTETGDRYDWDFNSVVHYTDETDLSGKIFIPNLGVKFFVLQQNKLQAYFSLNFSKPIISGKIEVGNDSIDNVFEDDFANQVKAVSIWGGEFGFGCEYFFDDNFSIGGEFGIRHLNFKYDYTYDYSFWNPNTGTNYDTEINDNAKLNSSPTFSKITLNYYFNRKE